ncbi:MAG: hypothetical protein LBR98_07090 [Syntrophomonadaceae bacterium]|jgi:hypothetical protein|nr:hypothetical protein [Syntrophomonadaceae bacterium]
MAANRNDFKYEITAQLGFISESGRAWRKEFNQVSWNGGEPKYDIRDWSENHERMGKGVTLTEAETRKLKELLEAEISRLDQGR